jgi:hypothetical protein
MMVKLADMSAGDYVTAWVMTGIRYNGIEQGLIQGRVIRVNRKTVSVLWLHSDRFQRVDPDDIYETKRTPFWE